MAVEVISSRNVYVLPYQYHSTNAPYSFSYYYYNHQKDKRDKAWEPSNKAVPYRMWASKEKKSILALFSCVLQTDKLGNLTDTQANTKFDARTAVIDWQTIMAYL